MDNIRAPERIKEFWKDQVVLAQKLGYKESWESNTITIIPHLLPSLPMNQNDYTLAQRHSHPHSLYLGGSGTGNTNQRPDSIYLLDEG